MRASLLRFLLAIAGGVLWGLCFNREPLSLASWLALAPLVVLLTWPRPGLLGWVHGLASWLTGLYWITSTLVVYGQMPRPLAVVLTGLLASYLALFHAAFAWLGSRLLRRGGWAPLVTLPALWVALEWLRTYLGGGFPWNLAGYTWVDVPGALPLSAWIGAYGISFLAVLTGTGVALSILRRSWKPAVLGLMIPLLLLPLAARWSLRRNEAALQEMGGFGRPVRLLQPNIANMVGYDEAAVVRNYQKVIALSDEACQPGALVVWPESAAWPFLYRRDAMLDRDLEDLVDRGCTVLFNSSQPVGEAYYNSAFLVSAAGPALRYDKRHLVPFGEYVPFKGIFGWMDKLARNAGDYRPADDMTLLPWGGEKLGMAICYEVVFPDEVADLVQAGATVLVTITNDAWYGDTSAPWQHLRAVRFRAAENRRPLLRAAITGVSAFVAPDGSVRAQLGVYRQGMIRARVLGEQGLTPYSRLPWLVPALSTAIALVGYALARGRRTQ